jgi:RNA polymerase sigma-70 factor (ECF subfamily)
MTDSTPSQENPRVFPATQWTIVVAAGATPSPESAAALERLCGSYWYPLYAYVRRCGHSPSDAEDLTQEFFARLLEHHWIARADRELGRFRSFLLTAMKRFLAKEWAKEQTLKRGGGVRPVPLRFDTAETRYCREPADTSTPEQVYERQWALLLLEAVLERLRTDYARDGKDALFDTLQPCLVGSREAQPYAALAARLGMTAGAVSMTVSRLRERYRECLKEEIRQTVASAAEVDGELRHLFRVLARG